MRYWWYRGKKETLHTTEAKKTQESPKTTDTQESQKITEKQESLKTTETQETKKCRSQQSPGNGNEKLKIKNFKNFFFLSGTLLAKKNILFTRYQYLQ